MYVSVQDKKKYFGKYDQRCKQGSGHLLTVERKHLTKQSVWGSTPSQNLTSSLWNVDYNFDWENKKEELLPICNHLKSISTEMEKNNIDWDQINLET